MKKEKLILPMKKKYHYLTQWDEDLLTRLIQRCQRDGKTRMEFIREAVEEKLKK